MIINIDIPTGVVLPIFFLQGMDQESNEWGQAPLNPYISLTSVSINTAFSQIIKYIEKPFIVLLLYGP